MDSTIVYYYSRKGSNRFLAERISKDLNCEIEKIQPRLNVFFFMLFGVNFGIKKLKHQPKNYEQIVLCGPIWMGKFIPPLRSFVKKHSEQIQKLTFVTCCGSTYDNKDEKFGHGLVFKIIEGILADKCIHCEAFPIGLVLPEDKRNDSDAFMKTHLNEDNFSGEILSRYDKFILKMKSI
jgi:flavodoxin